MNTYESIQCNHINARLMALDHSCEFTFHPDSLNEHEIQFLVPLDSGFSVGQRYEIEFGGSPESEELANKIGPVHYATILQTCCNQSQDDRNVTVNMRFDQPLFL